MDEILVVERIENREESMIELPLKDTDQIGGGISILGWIGQQVAKEIVIRIYGAAVSGQIDYAGVAESQGHYYNMTGA